MKYSSFIVLVASAMATMEVLKIDWYYRNCNVLVAKNAAITSSCKASHTEGRGSSRGALSAAQLKCMCNFDDYRLSMFGCFDYASQQADTGEKSIKESWAFLQKACSKYSDKATIDYDTNKKAYLAADITQSYKEANQTQSGAFMLDEKSLPSASCKVYAEAHWQGYNAQMFPLITTWYLAGILFVQACVHWSSFFIPGLIRVLSNNPVSRYLRRFIVLPALFNNHRANPMKLGRWFVLCFPPRLHIVFLLGYIFLSGLFLGYHYPWINDGKYWMSHYQSICKYLAVRSGQLGMHKMVWLTLFAGRNNILIWLTGWQFEIFNHWHRWVSRLFCVDIIIHTVAYWIALQSRSRLPHEWSLNYMIWGWVATAAMILLCVNGTKSIRQMGYEIFLYVHIILAVLCVVGTWYHIIHEIGMFELYAVIAIWGFDRLIRVVRMLVSNPMATANLKAHPDGTLEMEVTYSGLWKPTAGSYIFIYFVDSLYFFQSHPFTIVPLEEKGKLRLYSKTYKGVTKKIYNRAVKNGGECTSRVLIEGPYGVEFATKQFKEIVMIAGGIGVTAIYSHIKEIVKKNANTTQVIHVHWGMSGRSSLEWFKRELAEMASYPNVHIILHINENGIDAISSSSNSEEKSLEKQADSASELAVTSQRSANIEYAPKANFFTVVADHITNTQGDIVFFVCGPASMADDVRKAVAVNLFKTNYYVQFFEESFTM